MSNQTKVISLDHGNKNFKTANSVFNSSFTNSTNLPAMGGDTLTYDGTEYTLTTHRMPQKNDKTIDDAYFILTLFAIGKELADGLDSVVPNEPIDITLLAGLPPSHVRQNGPSFVRYLKREEPITFSLNSHPFRIRITDVYVFPQAYAAALTVADKIKDSRIVGVAYVGGYTVDCLQLIDFKADATTCTSLYRGTNTLFDKINDQIRTTGVRDSPDILLEGIIQNDPRTLKDCTPERIQLVKNLTTDFTREMLLAVSQAGIDLKQNKTLFIGGGALLLQQYIEQSGLVAKPVFVDDVHANARGYKLIYDKRMERKA